jgi:hypothetical protein
MKEFQKKKLEMQQELEEVIFEHVNRCSMLFNCSSVSIDIDQRSYRLE